MVYKKNQTDKWDLQQGKRGIFIGFPSQQSGWLIYSPEDGGRETVVSMDAVFDESFVTAISLRPADSKGALKMRHTHSDKDSDDNENWNDTEFEHTGDIVSTYSETGVTTEKISEEEYANICSCLHVEEGNTVSPKEVQHETKKDNNVTFTEDVYKEDKEDDIDALLSIAEDKDMTEVSKERCFHVIHQAMSTIIEDDSK